MGTWVAGDIADVSELPFTGNVLYDGTTLGTVARATGETYIASGNVSMTYDFGNRDGELTLSLDGMYVSAPTGSNAGTSQAVRLVRRCSQAAWSANGLAGSIQWRIGQRRSQRSGWRNRQFSFGNASVSAVGTFAASQTPP